MSKKEHNNIITIDEARILVLEVTENIDDLLLQLPELDITELEKHISEKRKREFLGVRIALKALLGKEIIVKYDADGKPFLADNSYHISVTHSGKWIAVMAHPTQLVGIDIEIPTDKIQKIYKRFLSTTEQEALSNGNNISQLQLAWSAKEALYKIIGKEAVDFAKQLRIFPFEVKPVGEISALHIESNTPYHLHYIQNPAYTLVYCLA
ncbi:MAG: 4'-phosphopantetheinyl transferase superfamily protein [Paludibacter sp.]|nr:4'-phosphopantetheinyl transferase superfamily protein [Paludibacter sp.]